MQLKPLASTIALAAALAFSGPVYAQSMINGMTIPEDELPLVQQQCDELKTAAGTESESTDESAGDAELEDSGDDAVEDEVEASGMAQAETPTIDLETIDLQACIDAGLVME
ncbi:hypothetical protein [Devosia nitrariae]|uniref:Secreted protein n=1 Tax=Devosia nitrariae TaxID=2071872 RepID=A0ABQ5W0X0_9HYPH|nr:hypothetical protein [Devosia nitrariae]GLQ53524.1 hypothetical protein GCM10010862_07830 [Devosia nitrariae]